MKVQVQVKKIPLVRRDDGCSATFDLLAEAVTEKSDDFNWFTFRWRLQDFCKALKNFHDALQAHIKKAETKVAERLCTVLTAVKAIFDTAVQIARLECKLEIREDDFARRVSV